jgi:ABC-type branched-subunit amino acid transport system permease subunit
MRRWLAPALTGLVIAGAVVLIAVLPRIASVFRLGQFTYVAIYFIALLGLNILTGYNGQISLGHAAFMAVGGYTATVLILGRTGFELAGHHAAAVIPEHGMGPIWTIPLAGLSPGSSATSSACPPCGSPACRSRSRRLRSRCRCRRSPSASSI